MQSSLGANTTRYPFSSLGIGTHHEVTLSSIGDGIIYLRDNPASKVQFVPQPQLPAPANLRADHDRIRRDAVANAAGYRVFLIDSVDRDPTVISPQLDADDTRFRPADLETGVEYRLALVALGDGQHYRDSDWTQAELAFTPSRPPDDDDGNGYVHPIITPVPTAVPECIRIDSYSRTETRVGYCPEGAPLTQRCTYRRECTGTCCRRSSTYCRVIDENCSDWELVGILRPTPFAG